MGQPGRLPGNSKAESKMAKNEKTSARVGTIASKAIRAPGSVPKKEIQSLGASGLTQRPDRKGGGAKKKKR